jgi:hypothetical protein
MKRLIIVLLTLTLGHLACRPDKAHAPISHYVREVGLRYLDELQQFQIIYAHSFHGSVEDILHGEEEVAHAHDRLDSLEEEIGINISQQSDQEFLSLLKNVRKLAEPATLEDMRTAALEYDDRLRHDPRFHDLKPSPDIFNTPAPAQAALYLKCFADAKAIIHVGVFGPVLHVEKMLPGWHRGRDQI